MWETILTILNSLIFLAIGIWIGEIIGGVRILGDKARNILSIKKAKAEMVNWVSPEEKEKKRQRKWLGNILKNERSSKKIK